jgi:uncharacterized protein YeaO (DUF488 family)
VANAVATEDSNKGGVMGEYKPTEDLLMKAGRINQFWKRFVTHFQNETKMGSGTAKSLLNIFQDQNLRVFKSRRSRW